MNEATVAIDGRAVGVERNDGDGIVLDDDGSPGTLIRVTSVSLALGVGALTLVRPLALPRPYRIVVVVVQDGVERRLSSGRAGRHPRVECRVLRRQRPAQVRVIPKRH